MDVPTCALEALSDKNARQICVPILWLYVTEGAVQDTRS
jgi:hypothetical protein